ncbi:MAG: hypothetical protein ABSE72_01685 [Bacteroidales bacterium]|jgi:hypothetical protein
MKRFFTLFFMVTCFTAVSQPLKRGTHVILIRDIRTSRFLRISENSNILVWTTSGKQISGQVKLIKTDTLFFNDTLVKVSDIDKLFFQSKFAFPDQPQYNENTPAYVAGSHNWQIICPPESAYSSPWSYKVYMQNLATQEKKDHISSTDPLAYKNFLKFNIIKLAHLELALSYERLISKNFTWETEFSAILGIPSANAYYTIDYPLYNYSGFSVTTYPKYFFYSGGYLGIVMMYRNLWFTGVRTDWPDKGDGSGALQDQYRNDFGLSLRIGLMKRYGKFVIDWYLGGGIKYIMLHQLLYGIYEYHDDNQMWWKHPDHSPDVNNRILFGPVINLGIKIGLAIGHQGK